MEGGTVSRRSEASSAACVSRRGGKLVFGEVDASLVLTVIE